MDKILTIGIPAYNAEKTIKNCIDSFISTGLMEDIQIIIVNDGSKDKTSLIAHEYQQEYPDSILVIDKENGGHGSGINISIKFASGKYIKIVDSDDAVDRDGFVSLIRDLKVSDSELILSPYFEVKDKEKKFISYRFDDTPLKKRVISIKSDSDLRFAMHSMTYRTDVLKKSKYQIDEHCFYVDVEYSLYYLVGVKNILLLCDPVYLYTVGTENQSVNFKNMKKNIDQHTHVCEQLIKFYELEKKNITEELVAEVIKKNIINMILNSEYWLIFSLPNTFESKKRLLQIESFTKNTCREIYDDIVANGNKKRMKSMYCLSILRTLNYHFYFIFHIVFKKRLKNV